MLRRDGHDGGSRVDPDRQPLLWRPVRSNNFGQALRQTFTECLRFAGIAELNSKQGKGRHTAAYRANLILKKESTTIASNIYISFGFSE